MFTPSSRRTAAHSTSIALATVTPRVVANARRGLRRAAFALAAVATLATATAALPSVADAAEGRSGRYTMTPTKDGFLRLDTKTGEMALCNGRSGAFACELVADDSRKLKARVAELERQNARLKADNERLDKMLNADTDDNARPSPPRRSFKLPSEQEVDKAMDYVERMFRKFRERLQRLEKEKDGRGTQL